MDYLLIVFLFLLSSIFFTFMTDLNIIQNVFAQANLDSFTAKGFVFSRLTQSPLLATQELNTSQSTNTITNNSNTSNNSLLESNSMQNLPFIEGGWELVVQKGEVKIFRVIFTLNQGNKVLNAFAIENLKSHRYVQLNDKGTEIISGTVDFISGGLRNETLTNIDATITITGLSRLRVNLDNNSTSQFLNAPLMGELRFLADANGNILIAPRPQSPPPSPQSPGNIPQFSPSLSSPNR
jgi:hypothetical protein